MKQRETSTFVPFLVIGIMLNTMGVAFSEVDWIRYLLMLVGLGLILFSLLRMLQQRQR